jgi:hypothetical protein
MIWEIIFWAIVGPLAFAGGMWFGDRFFGR